MHGFAQDADGEIYALVTNTSASGAGGIVYKLTPMRLTTQQAGNVLSISWPVVGGHLQGQTNAPGVGITTNWVTVPGSTGTTNVAVPINPTNGSVFYRLSVP